MSTVSKETMAILASIGITEANIDELKKGKLKLVENKPIRKKKTSGMPAQEYILSTTWKCSLCGSEVIHVLLMQRMEDDPSCLQGVKLEGAVPEGLRTEHRLKVWNTCRRCRGWLAEKSKEELVDMVMKAHVKKKGWLRK